MMMDTDWPAAEPEKSETKDCSGTYRARLVACIAYLVLDARQHGYRRESNALESVLNKINSAAQ